MVAKVEARGCLIICKFNPLPNCFDLPLPICYIITHLSALPHSPLIERSGNTFRDGAP